MSKVSVLLVYEVPGGRPFTVARTDDPGVVASAVSVVLREADARAISLAGADEVLGAVECEEAGRLRRVLRLLVPDVMEANGRTAAEPAGVM